MTPATTTSTYSFIPAVFAGGGGVVEFVVLSGVGVTLGDELGVAVGRDIAVGVAVGGVAGAAVGVGVLVGSGVG